MIDINKQYKTMDGHNVIIYSTNGFCKEFPVIAEVIGDDYTIVCKWNHDGYNEYRGSFHLKLIEVLPVIL